jgi:DNA-binding transcriptional ArsR family regulator
LPVVPAPVVVCYERIGELSEEDATHKRIDNNGKPQPQAEGTHKAMISTNIAEPTQARPQEATFRFPELPHQLEKDLVQVFKLLSDETRLRILLYLVRDNLKENEKFVESALPDLCASYQEAINSFLIRKLRKAMRETGIKEVGIAGGVAANSNLQAKAHELVANAGGNLYIPAVQYCMDNAAMIGVAGWYKYLDGQFAGPAVVPYAKSPLKYEQK